VRFQGDSHFVVSDSKGTSELPAADASSRRITASKEGYFIAGSSSDANPLTIKLTPLPAQDHENYSWVDPTPDPAKSQNCGNCHRQIYDEWSASGHARSATNRRFLNLYDGMDWQGRSHVGWSLRDEHPDGIGVCNACHAPTASFDTDLRKIGGTEAQGVHCDFCHKVAKTSTEKVGYTHGRYGLELFRPTSPDTPSPREGGGKVRGSRQAQIFFGPLDDVDRGEDVYSPLYRESRYCASCHEGVVFGVPVYSTYSEWLESPARKEGKQCQSCHMAPTGTMSNIAPGSGGIERDPHTLGNHRFFDTSQAEMLRRSLTVTADVVSNANGVGITVHVQADHAGHRVPTGFVDRNLLLLVEAVGANGSIAPLEGPKIPSFAGAEWAGKAGKVYTKRLTDFDGNSPVPFWRARPEVEDNRLYSGQVDSITWRFPLGADHIRIRLIYRRFWPEASKTKGWPKDDIVVVEKELQLKGQK
jgi:hypothetical protein